MADHPELLNLLRACKDDPADDQPRLVLADWLEEHGQAGRAEFVRVQCRWAGLDWYAPEVPELEARQAELLRADGDGWLAPARALGLPGLAFRCGLVATAGSPEDFRPLLAAKFGPAEE